jgi:hypothetical protein
MNEQMTTLLTSLATDLITKVQNGIDTGTAFVSEQAPILIIEITKIGILNHAIGIIVFSLLFLVMCFCVLLSIHFLKKELSTTYPCTDGCILSIIFSSIGLVCFLSGIIGNIYGILYIQMAPRLFIIQQLKSLFM